MSQYYVVISFQFENEKETTVLLDTIDDVQITTSSTITEHPVPTGDIVADHMFKNPVTMDITGSISLAGSSQNVLGAEGNKLVNFQELFEKIKNTGTLCTIYKLNTLTNDIRFVKRDRMALNNIRWVERINTLDFTFSFRQILAVTIQEYDVDIDDAYLPNVTEPKTLSFTDTLLDWDQVDKAVYATLVKFKLIADDFVTYMAGATKTSLVALGVSLVAAKVVISFVGGAAAIGPVGWAIIGITGAAAAIVGTVTAVIKIFKRAKYQIKEFKYYEDDRKMQQEVRRFSEFTSQIHMQLQQLNESMKVYQVSDDSDQECMLTIGNNYYIFSFVKNNTSGKYSLKVTGGADDIDEERKILSDISGCPDSFYDCTDENRLFLADESGEFVYLIKTDSENEDKLTSYAILATAMQPSNFNNAINDIIYNAIRK